MILAFHVTFGAYGHWLPNDPRGSWSTRVAQPLLQAYGSPKSANTRRSVARRAHDHQARRAARQALLFEPVRLNGRQALAAAQGFDRARVEGSYAIHALAILPDHVHLVVGRHDRDVRRILAHLKRRSRQQIQDAGLWFDDGRPVWSEGGWHVYLDSPEAVQRAIGYVNANPQRSGLRTQRWSFVTPWSAP